MSYLFPLFSYPLINFLTKATILRPFRVKNIRCLTNIEGKNCCVRVYPDIWDQMSKCRVNETFSAALPSRKIPDSVRNIWIFLTYVSEDVLAFSSFNFFLQGKW